MSRGWSAPCSDLTIGGVVERLGQLTRHAQRLWQRAARPFSRTTMSSESARGEILREKCVIAGIDPGGARRRRRLDAEAPRRCSCSNSADQLMHAFRRKIEAGRLYGDESIAIGVIRTKDRSQSTIANLMQHAKWTEGVRRRGAGSFRVQSRLL